MLLGMGSCSKKESPAPIPSGDYLVFGTSYGMCAGNCSPRFRIQGGSLYPSDTAYDAPMSKAAYDSALILWTDFPVYLTAHPDTTFGCPDCHDQGGIYIQRKAGGVSSTWHIDTDTATQPETIRPYITRLYKLVYELKK